MLKRLAVLAAAITALAVGDHLNAASIASAQSASVTRHPAPANMHTDNMHTDRVLALPTAVTTSSTYQKWEDACWQTIPYGPKRFRCFEIGYDRAVAGELTWGTKEPGWKAW